MVAFLRDRSGAGNETSAFRDFKLLRIDTRRQTITFKQCFQALTFTCAVAQTRHYPASVFGVRDGRTR